MFVCTCCMALAAASQQCLLPFSSSVLGTESLWGGVKLAEEHALPSRSQNTGDRQTAFSSSGWKQKTYLRPNLLQSEGVWTLTCAVIILKHHLATEKYFLNTTVLVHEDPAVTLVMFAPEGMVSASKESVSYVLDNKGGGHASVIVIGGAEESLNAHPGSLTLNILKRKGFIKMALKHG